MRQDKSSKLHASTRKAIREVFSQLDYDSLGSIYCDEGGTAFWETHRKPCERIGSELARRLKPQLTPGGASLYVGAGVAEIPSLIMEILELTRCVAAFNLRQEEVVVLNQTCKPLGLTYDSSDAQNATGAYDHVWIVSVLNDPERFPELSALSYGQANPTTFDTMCFQRERETVLTLTDSCLKKLLIPGLVTTSVEEIPWISNWCEQQTLPYTIGEKDYPTAIVKDPICFIQIG